MDKGRHARRKPAYAGQRGPAMRPFPKGAWRARPSIGRCLPWRSAKKGEGKRKGKRAKEQDKGRRTKTRPHASTWTRPSCIPQKNRKEYGAYGLRQDDAVDTAEIPWRAGSEGPPRHPEAARWAGVYIILVCTTERAMAGSRAEKHERRQYGHTKYVLIQLGQRPRDSRMQWSVR